MWQTSFPWALATLIRFYSSVHSNINSSNFWEVSNLVCNVIFPLLSDQYTIRLSFLSLFQLVMLCCQTLGPNFHKAECFITNTGFRGVAFFDAITTQKNSVEIPFFCHDRCSLSFLIPWRTLGRKSQCRLLAVLYSHLDYVFGNIIMMHWHTLTIRKVYFPKMIWLLVDQGNSSAPHGWHCTPHERLLPLWV